MIVLDTHIWVWWVQGDARLTQRHRQEIDKSQKQGIGICSISCLEVARLVERGRLGLPDEVTQWLEKALSYPGIVLLTLTARFARIQKSKVKSQKNKKHSEQVNSFMENEKICISRHVVQEILRPYFKPLNLFWWFFLLNASCFKSAEPPNALAPFDF